ncbi:hypothetical protein PMAYCL1PPCAC_11030, partial [Pristionchus mayeri]
FVRRRDGQADACDPRVSLGQADNCRSAARERVARTDIRHGRRGGTGANMGLTRARPDCLHVRRTAGGSERSGYRPHSAALCKR